MSAKGLLGEFLTYTVVEPVLTVALGLGGVLIGLIRVFWGVILGFLLIGWICETIIALLVWNERGLLFWFYFGGVFTCGMIAKRIATFPVKKGLDWIMAGGLKRGHRAGRDEPFADVPPGRPVIEFANPQRR